MAVIGAGLAGLSLTRHLQAQGMTVKLIEKSDRPGGRLSTRETPFGSFDVGAQYLTNRTPAFAALINLLTSGGQVAAWKPSGKDSARPWWTGVPGMSTIPDALARSLDIDLGVEALGIAASGDRFEISARNRDGTEHRYTANQVVAAIPAPQARTLLSPLDPVFETLDTVQMAPCLSAALAFGAPLSGVRDLIRGQQGEALAQITRNSSKPGRSGETFVIQAMPGWSRERIDSPPAAVLAEMLIAMRFQTGLGADLPPPLHLDLDFWRYALVETPLSSPFLANQDNTLFACGDWCIAARAEAAHQSGLALAEHILSL
ncbi:hypothetical protein AWJ14_10285 [Hoeflea olei]|uniref:Amine oxidase domain-containing protein n=1 Tax=Hoeflea olei TaxID=1480615 RepID=A0A1C1Z0W1_9HYPH|nr:hypothetical protein AWJ14_10285 [Hoeflea olei]